MCHCFDGWTGPTCNVPVSACGSNPCQNGATCSDLPGGLYTCACTAEYTGPHCEEVRQGEARCFRKYFDFDLFYEAAFFLIELKINWFLIEL